MTRTRDPEGGQATFGTLVAALAWLVILGVIVVAGIWLVVGLHDLFVTMDGRVELWEEVAFFSVPAGLVGALLVVIGFNVSRPSGLDRLGVSLMAGSLILGVGAVVVGALF